MGLDAAWRKMKQTARDLNDARNLRLSDPRIKARLDHQRDKTRDSFYSMGRQAQNVATSAVFDLALKTMLPGERTKKGKLKSNMPQRLGSGVMQVSLQSVGLVARILMFAGRATYYGSRRGIAI